MTKPNYLERELETLIRTDPDVWKFIRQGSLDGVWYWDLENPDQEYMSPEFWHTFGFDPATKDHLASEWQDLIYPEDLEIAKENVARHCADPNHPYDQVVRYLCADGSTAWVRCRGLAIRDADGKPIRLLGAHNDITEAKRAEARAIDELETVFNAASSAIIAVSKSGQIVRLNSQARHILGGINDATPFAWPNDIQFLDPKDLTAQDDSHTPLMRALAGETIKSETNVITRLQAGLHHRYVRISSAPVKAVETELSCVLVIDDVTVEERNRQAADRKSRLDALGQLTGGIAHDFNNLLASQLYALALVKLADDIEERDHYLENAEATIERGRALTARLLTFARQQPGTAKSKKTAGVFEEFQRLVRPMLEAEIELHFEVEDDDLHHFCDQVQLETALMNLVLNSRDAILDAQKGSRIKVSARSQQGPWELDETAKTRPVAPQDDKSYRFIEFNITDDGPGMDSSTLERSTDPFFTTKDTNSGTGLGLAMVYGFAKQSDGDFRIYSEEGIGTTVLLKIPRGTPEGPREAPVSQAKPKTGLGHKLLVVEDDPQLLTMVADLVKKLGYQPITAKSGVEALALIGSGETFDLVLTDVVMPGGMSGFELAAQIRETNPAIPVIYTSGYTGFTAAEMGEIQAPLLQKPVRPVELSMTLQKLLSS